MSARIGVKRTKNDEETIIELWIGAFYPSIQRRRLRFGEKLWAKDGDRGGTRTRNLWICNPVH